LKIVAFMGSPRVKGLNGKLLASALKGAASRGAEVKRYDLVKCTIEYCRGCFRCVHENHGLPIGKCPINDDMAGILEEYLDADGYIFTTPVYDVGVTAIMKTFLERKFPLFHRKKEETGKIPAARVTANFKKKASFIVTGNCADEFEECMGTPCFEAMESDFFIEQIDTVDRFFVGSADDLTSEILAVKEKEAFELGVRLVDAIRAARNSDLSLAS
jgi:multimeric flavodoxin WrbA